MDEAHPIWRSPRMRAAVAAHHTGAIVRLAREAQHLTQTQVGRHLGYSASTISRLETGRQRLQDLPLLQRLADFLGIPHHLLGLAPPTPIAERRLTHVGTSSLMTATVCHAAPKVRDNSPRQDGDEALRRRHLLANLTVTAAAAGGLPPRTDAPVGDANHGDLLLQRVRDAMLGLGSQPITVPPDRLRADLGGALADFHACRYRQLSVALPRLITGAQALTTDTDDQAERTLPAEIYLLVTRMLIKLDDRQLGLMAADRARVFARTGDNPFTIAEAARNLAVLARKAGWHSQAMAIALDAADDPRLHDGHPATTAERGLLIQSAAYTAAHTGDSHGMRHLTDEAAALAAQLRGPHLLRDHGGGFSPATVQLHRISAENSLHEPCHAIAAARTLPPATLPTIERRARYYTDLATAFGQAGHRDPCIHALLAAERHAPEETHTRPTIRTLITDLLTSGRTTPDLRALAARSGIR